MGLFTDGFKLLKKASEPLYKTPKSIQETIEIMAVAENGIFEVSKNKYSKCYRFQDINYTTATEDEQIGIFERYCKFLNSLDCNYKITINNKNKNMDELRDKVLIAEKNDGFNNYRSIYNDIIEEKIIEGRQGIEQERYLTITIERKNFEEAKAQFATLEATIHKAFIELGAEIVPLNGNERLKVLYDYYHLGDEGSFDFDIKKAKKVGADFRNDLCNGMVKYFPDHFEDESKFCKALFIKKYPSSLSDRFINEITSLPVHSITSIDVVPVPKDLTTKVLQKKYLGIESDIIKQQRVRNKNNDFSTEISYAKRTEKKEIEEIMDDVREMIRLRLQLKIQVQKLYPTVHLCCRGLCFYCLIIRTIFQSLVCRDVSCMQNGRFLIWYCQESWQMIKSRRRNWHRLAKADFVCRVRCAHFRTAALEKAGNK